MHTLSLHSQSVPLLCCESYSRSELMDCMERIMSCLANRHTFTGAVVLLKPNLISSRGPSLACTNAEFLAAAASWFLDQGARVIVGDSPAFGSVQGVMANHGMIRTLKLLDVAVVQFKTPVSRQLENGVTVKIAAEALECDYLINLPKIKAHNQMYLTAAVKNLFGTVVGMRKAMIHMRHGDSHREFADILLRIPSLLPEQYCLADGVKVMHRSGPLNGDLFLLQCMAGARCPVALDTTLLEMLDLDKQISPLWQAAAAVNHPGSVLDNIQFPLLTPSRFSGSGFVAPTDLTAIRFNPLRFMVNGVRRLGLAIHSYKR